MTNPFSSKGTILPILLIFLFGLAAISGFFLYTNPKALQNLSFAQLFQAFPKTEQSSLISSTPVTSEPVSLSLNINNPDNNLLVFESDLLISGKTSPNTTLVLSLDKEDWVGNIDNLGNFSDTAKLKEGVNHLVVTVFDSQGNSKSESRTIYFSKEKL